MQVSCKILFVERMNMSLSRFVKSRSITESATFGSETGAVNRQE